MRIVHEIESRATVSGGCTPYVKMPDKDRASGFHADLLILVEARGFAPSEELHIEGNAKYILAALREAVMMLEEVGADFVADGRVCENWQELPPLDDAPLDDADEE